MKRISRAVSVILAITLLLSLAGCGASDGKTHLKFQIWDVAQRDSMQAICDAYTAKNPDVVIEVQVTSWNEYWTKLEAAAESNTMPDIFWMHTNQILYYSDFGMLADVTDLYEDVEPNYYQNHFSEISIGNAQGSNGRMYGVPKDKDNIFLVYNKEMFDAAGVAYPDENWTWDDLTSASQTIYDKTGKYGYMAYSHDQIGYWNFVYQNGGQILNDDGTKAEYTEAATADAIRYYVEIQKNDWCPTQEQFANTGAAEMFFSGEGAMYYAGNWDLINLCTTYGDMNGKWDVAMLPKCPDPANGDGRASISNSVSYATAAKGKNKELAMDFLKFLGSEEAQKIQGESGAAIPAYNGLEDAWVQSFADKGYELTLENLIGEFEYSVKYVNNPSRPSWEPKVEQTMLDIYAGSVTIDEGIEKMQSIVTEAMEE